MKSKKEVNDILKKKEKDTIIKLSPKDSALILREDDKIEICFPKFKNEEEKVDDSTYIISGLAFLLTTEDEKISKQFSNLVAKVMRKGIEEIEK